MSMLKGLEFLMKVDVLSIVSLIFFLLTFVPVAIVMTGTALTIIGML